MKPHHKTGIIGALIVACFVAIVIWNQKQHRFERNVEELHRQTEDTSNEWLKYGVAVTQSTNSWGGNPTNSPVCEKTEEEKP